MPSVAWLPWSIEAFAVARVERKPVLLSITTTWSQACRAMDAESYRDPEVAALVSDRFVPIRVDADRRPDISERYSLGGWPTTAFLTCEGAVVGGGTFIPRVRILAVLQSVIDAFGQRAGEIGARAEHLLPETADTARAAADPPDDQTLAALVFSSFDDRHGGFGSAPKFPLTAPIRLALQLHRDHADERMAHIATASLDAIGFGALHDEADGGFFRCAESRSWEQPHREKLLEVNASLIDLFVAASDILGAERYADRAQDALRYVHTHLADHVDGGWAASQRADPGTGSRALPLLDAPVWRPAVDRTLYANLNGGMVSAALRAARVFQDDTLGTFALNSLERVLAACYKPGDGVAHYVFAGMRTGGMLDDQVAVAMACLDAFEATGNIVYQMMAEELARHARRTMWDETRGAFVDRCLPVAREQVGRMARQLTPFVGNCDAAAMLLRLAESTGNQEFAVSARAALAAISPAAAAQGPLAAHYLLARREVGVR